MAGNIHEVVIFAGPHGAGKDTIEQAFTEADPSAVHHVRYSSRAQAAGEVDGQTYHFVSQDQFGAMVDQDAFIDFAHYPEGSSGIARADLARDVKAHLYISITTNFEEGLSLANRLARLEMQRRCLFIGPCALQTMVENPDEYLNILAERMARRARPSDDIERRLRKAALYRELFLDHQSTVPYIANEDGKQHEALQQVRLVLGQSAIA